MAWTVKVKLKSGAKHKVRVEDDEAENGPQAGNVGHDKLSAEHRFTPDQLKKMTILLAPKDA